MKKKLFLWFLIPLSCFMVACDRPSEMSGIKEGNPFPHLDLQTMDNKAFSLASLKGQRVVIKFWATWCSVCREMAPAFDKMMSMRNTESLVVVSLSVDHDVNLWREYLMSHERGYAQVIDVAMEESVAKLGLKAIPVVVVLDEQGIVKKVYEGRQSWGRSLLSEIEAL